MSDDDYPANWDQDALAAAADLFGRCGASEVEFGYLHDDVPADHADWYCTAMFRGTKIIAEHHTGPIEACEALARRLMNGGMCTHCRRVISLSSPRDLPQVCRWTRQGDRWVRGCTETVPEGQRDNKMIREWLAKHGRRS
ncbi:MAG: hypothetical protein VYA67_22110 [Actinomycetota bacterium]|nr:hypothetical protein [Actinomycetota bacterium]